MKLTSSLVFTVVLLFVALSAHAQDAAGWRGDGSGKYPKANPPLAWERSAKSIQDLSVCARKPKDDAAPAKTDAITDGEIRKWLVLGPIPVADDKKSDEVLPNAEAFAPDENEKAGDLTWQAVKTDTSCLDLCAVLKKDAKDKDYAAYACAWIHSPSDRSVGLNHMFSGQGTNRVWLNGVQVYTSGKNIDIAPCARLTLPLKKGWNRLVILVAKTRNSRFTCWFTASLYGQSDAEYETHGIVWSTPMPSVGMSSPVIADGRIFFTAESGSLVCVNKSDGKLMWVRSLTYFDFATEEEERKAKPEIFEELAPLAEKVKQLDLSDVISPWKPPALEKDRRTTIENQIEKGMRKVSHEKYCLGSSYGCEAGNTAPAPTTDGKRVWALFGSGIIACFDLDGNLQWSRLLKHADVEHGYTTSPLLVDGKIIVYFENFTVMDANTGKVLVERPYFFALGHNLGFYSHFHGTGIVLPAGNEKVVYYLNGEFVRLSDGKTLELDLRKLAVLQPKDWREERANRLATPVVEGGVAYKIAYSQGGAVAFRLPPLDGDKVNPEIICEAQLKMLAALQGQRSDDIPYYYEPCHCASPLYHEGLLYCVNDFGWLRVYDMTTGDIVYKRLLDTEVFMPYTQTHALKGGVQSSPALAGKYIYIWGNQGTCIVIEPGRTFKQVAKNRIENYISGWQAHQEATTTEPIFDGDRIYYRGECTLYCIGPK